MKDPRERFAATVDNYEKYRPGYPPELVEWIVSELKVAPGARVADLGCGTGISTRLFASRGFRVVGIDPNEEMLKRATRAGGAEYVRGEATATGLADQCVDFVVGGQSFHWFDLAPSFREFQRILKPGGWCAAFWNVRTTGDPFLDDYEEILKRHSAEYANIGRHDNAVPKLRAFPGLRDLREAAFPNRQSLNFEGLVGRAWSSSYVVHGVEDRGAFDADLKAAFDRHQKEGAVDFNYRTEVIAWRLTPLRPASGSA